ncbi:MAG: NHL repeat-containing protein, partial [Anaerolineae bacterium]|nr:NHL repeat-containing protein [Anaerolineae bacterium]
AYDDDVSWPFTWYLRNYPNHRYYGNQPTRDLRNAPLIIVGDDNFAAIEPIVSQGYYMFEYIRMWWPNQDYFHMTSERFINYFRDPMLRKGIFDIWLDRDYRAYGQAVGQDFSLPNWSPADRMRLYVRKDVAAQLWEYGLGPSSEAVLVDPYESKGLNIFPDKLVGSVSPGEEIFNGPRDVAISPDGTLFVSDSRNHRILKIKDGEVIDQWGSLTNPGEIPAADGTFNEPWGLAVSPDGKYVYVADTWNHRVQKFTATGRFVSTWGYFDQSEDPYAMWGPRDIATDAEGNVYVSNTGNKRITVFEPDGTFITQFGEVGFSPGEFDEPVGLAVDQSTGWVYVADTWNQRIQVFEKGPDNIFHHIKDWEINGWFGQSLENKPFLALDTEGNLYVSDPELSRILVFNPNGEFLYYFGDFGLDESGIGIANGVAIDPQGGVWVVDAGKNYLLHYSPGQ